jgi:hypothetical protein
MRTTLIALCCFAIGCGGDGGGGGADAGFMDAPPNVPAMITISGEATKREGAGSATPAEGVMVAAYKNSDPNTPIATATTDAAGLYTLTVTTNGQALDGYLKSTLAGFLDTYLYPPRPLVENFDGASLNIINQSSLDLLNTLCQNSQDPANAVIAVLVVDATDTAVEGAAVASTPASGDYCYNADSGFPGGDTVTNTDGIAYMLNVPAGNVMVTATKSGTTFRSHTVTARVDALTTTVIQP